MYCLTDLPDSRWESSLQNLIFYILQNLFLLFTDITFCHIQYASVYIKSYTL